MTRLVRWDALCWGILVRKCQGTARLPFSLRCLVCKGWYPRVGWHADRRHPRCRQGAE